MQQNKPNLRIGWVAMRRKLLTQAKQENERIGVNNIEYISMFDHDPPKVDLMITDEGHHDATASCSTLHKRTNAKLFLGLTSTPFRTDRVKLCFEKIIRDYGVRFLIESGYLSSFRQFIIPNWKPETVAARYLAEPERWGKSIAYFWTEQECHQFQTLLLQKGIKCAVILGKTPFAQQERIYNQFESGDLKIVVNINLLTEGFDSPNLRTIWVRDASKLPTTQMAGRVLRKDPNDTTKIANIIQSEHTKFPYTKITKVNEEYSWQDNKWLSFRKNELIDRISSTTIQVLSNIQSDRVDIKSIGNIKLTKTGKLSFHKSYRRSSQTRSIDRYF